jgi:hypothetical protein
MANIRRGTREPSLQHRIHFKPAESAATPIFRKVGD